MGFSEYINKLLLFNQRRKRKYDIKYVGKILRTLKQQYEEEMRFVIFVAENGTDCEDTQEEYDDYKKKLGVKLQS